MCLSHDLFTSSVGAIMARITHRAISNSSSSGLSFSTSSRGNLNLENASVQRRSIAAAIDMSLLRFRTEFVKPSSARASATSHQLGNCPVSANSRARPTNFSILPASMMSKLSELMRCNKSVYRASIRAILITSFDCRARAPRTDLGPLKDKLHDAWNQGNLPWAFGSSPNATVNSELSRQNQLRQFCALVGGVAEQRLAVELAFHVKMHIAFPCKADPAVELHGFA